MNDCWQLKADFKKKIPEHFNYWLFEVEKLGAALKSLMPVSALTKLAQFDGVIPLILDDEVAVPIRRRKSTTLIDLTHNRPTMIRAGNVTTSEVQTALDKVGYGQLAIAADVKIL